MLCQGSGMDRYAVLLLFHRHHTLSLQLWLESIFSSKVFWMFKVFVDCHTPGCQSESCFQLPEVLRFHAGELNCGTSGWCHIEVLPFVEVVPICVYSKCFLNKGLCYCHLGCMWVHIISCTSLYRRSLSHFVQNHDVTGLVVGVGCTHFFFFLCTTHTVA